MSFVIKCESPLGKVSYVQRYYVDGNEKCCMVERNDATVFDKAAEFWEFKNELEMRGVPSVFTSMSIVIVQDIESTVDKLVSL